MAHAQVVQQFQPVPSQLWWSDKGRKMQIDKLDLRFGILRIANPAIATVKIEKKSDHEFWRVYWSIVHFMGDGSGTVMLTEAELRAAFDLPAPDFRNANLVLDLYEADVASQNGFIRHGTRLAIPGPGQPWQGGASVSVRITDEIQEAVTQLIASQK